MKCAECKFLKPIFRHPSNQMTGGRMCGPVTMQAGFVCTGVDDNHWIFFETDEHCCELFSPKLPNL